MLPVVIQLAMVADIALNAIAAIVGPEHVTIVQSPIGQFGVLVAAGIVIHEVSRMARKSITMLQRRRRCGLDR